MIVGAARNSDFAGYRGYVTANREKRARTPDQNGQDCGYPHAESDKSIAGLGLPHPIAATSSLAFDVGESVARREASTAPLASHVPPIFAWVDTQLLFHSHCDYLSISSDLDQRSWLQLGDQSIPPEPRSQLHPQRLRSPTVAPEVEAAITQLRIFPMR